MTWPSAMPPPLNKKDMASGQWPPKSWNRWQLPILQSEIWHSAEFRRVSSDENEAQHQSLSRAKDIVGANHAIGTKAQSKFGNGPERESMARYRDEVRRFNIEAERKQMGLGA